MKIQKVIQSMAFFPNATGYLAQTENGWTLVLIYRDEWLNQLAITMGDAQKALLKLLEWKLSAALGQAVKLG